MDSIRDAKESFVSCPARFFCVAGDQRRGTLPVGLNWPTGPARCLVALVGTAGMASSAVQVFHVKHQ